MDLLHKLNNILPRSSLITIYKSFIRPHLDYVNVSFNKLFNHTFHQEFELFQYNVVLAITGAVKGLSTEKKLRGTWKLITSDSEILLQTFKI